MPSQNKRSFLNAFHVHFFKSWVCSVKCTWHAFNPCHWHQNCYNSMCDRGVNWSKLQHVKCFVFAEIQGWIVTNGSIVLKLFAFTVHCLWRHSNCGSMLCCCLQHSVNSRKCTKYDPWACSRAVSCSGSAWHHLEVWLFHGKSVCELANLPFGCGCSL